MKVCFISASVYSKYHMHGGIEAHIKRVARELVRRGHQISIITTASGTGITRAVREETEDIRVYSFYPLNIFERGVGLKKPFSVRLVYHAIDHLWNPQPYLVIKNILARERPDVVHVHNWRGFSLSLFSAIRSQNIPLVLTVHDYSLICPRSTLLRSSGRICNSPPSLCRLYKAVRRVAVGDTPAAAIGVSRFVVDKLREFSLFRNTEVTWLLNPIELEASPPVTKDHQGTQVLYLGKLIKAKGVGVLVEAIKQMGHDNMKLHIVGEGDRAAELSRQAVSDSRITLHGFMSQDELGSLYKRVHLAVVPSLWHEPCPIVVMESFTKGIPVIASRMGGLPELIQDGYNGFLFRAGDEAELRQILERLISDPALLHKLSQGALESAKRYEVSKYVQSLIEIYEEAQKRKRWP